MRLDLGRGNLVAVRDDKAGGGVIAFYDKIGVKVLKQICQTPCHMVRMTIDLQGFEVRFNFRITRSQSDRKEGGERPSTMFCHSFYR